MTARILAVGDIVGPGGVDFIVSRLRRLRESFGADLVIANGENASVGNGLRRSDAEILFNSGVDIITSGNHIFKQRDIYDFLDERSDILRPANYPGSCPGSGSTVITQSGVRYLVINLLGNVYMPQSLADPFDTLEALLERYDGEYDISLVDFHAEATSEKLALARAFDGRVSAVFGTHTHVQTADARVLPGGTAFITDLGMTGPEDSILGVKSEIIIENFRTKMPARFSFAEGNVSLSGAIIEVDTKAGRALSIEGIGA